MSAVPVTRPAPPRILGVVRMQLTYPLTFLWIPLIVLGGSLALVMAVYAILANSGVEGIRISGALQAPLWYLLVVGVQSLTLTFPFSQALSVSRREFFLGTLATAAITAAMLAAVSVVGGLLEQATDGWGAQWYFFWSPDPWSAGPLGALLFFFVAAMLFFIAGLCGATVYKRFGAPTLTFALFGVGVVLVAALWVVGLLDAWQAVLTAVAAQGIVGFSLWGVALAVVLAGGSMLMLRRATP